MRIFDPIYGQFEVPPRLTGLLATPEVRRLSQIRLLNTLTPTLATLGELRRYSHTLGVLRLCLKLRLDGYSPHEREALLASVLLHDVGTPPFGHLLEYYFADKNQWSHEAMIGEVLLGRHAPENIAHQFFGGRTIRFYREMKTAGINVDLVEGIIRREHPLSELLFGSVDLDNIDNVVRMAWALGMRYTGDIAGDLASEVHVSRNRALMLPLAMKDLVIQWLNLRSAVYDILVFDGPTVAAQAVLSEAIERAIAADIITPEEWSWSDEDLLDKLRRHDHTKDLIQHHYLGKLPQLAFAVQIEGSLSSLGLEDRGIAKNLLQETLKDVWPRDTSAAYVFVDKGAFSKRLRFVDPQSGSPWVEGYSSTSIVFYTFLYSRRPSEAECRGAVLHLLDILNVKADRVLRWHHESFNEQGHDQFTLGITTENDRLGFLR